MFFSRYTPLWYKVVFWTLIAWWMFPCLFIGFTGMAITEWIEEKNQWFRAKEDRVKK